MHCAVRLPESFRGGCSFGAGSEPVSPATMYCHISFGFGSLLQRPCRFVTWIIPVTLLGRGVLRLSVNALAGYPAETREAIERRSGPGRPLCMGKEIEGGWLMASANRKDGVGLAAMMCLVIEQVRQNITSCLRPGPSCSRPQAANEVI